MKFLASILLVCSVASAEPYLTYDSARRVDFFSGGGYQRDEYSWFIKNTGEPSRLFLNGVYQNSETGTNDVRFLSAWTIQHSGVPIGVVDIVGGHADRVRGLAELCGNTTTTFVNSGRSYDAETMYAASNLVTQGLRVIVITTGWNVSSPGMSNVCRLAESSNALLVCSVPNVAQNIDTTADYPSSLAGTITSIVPVTNTDRNGILYNPAAWGTNVIGAPGRNIVSAGTYSSGTSYSAPIVAGALSLLVARFPNQTSAAYREALKVSSQPAGLIRRLDAVALLKAPEVRLDITSTALRIGGIASWVYTLQHSDDLLAWTDTGIVSGQSEAVAATGFWRTR